MRNRGSSALRSPGQRTEHRNAFGSDFGGKRGHTVRGGSDDRGRLPWSVSRRHGEARRGSAVVEAWRYQVVMATARPVRKRGGGKDGMQGSAGWI